MNAPAADVRVALPRLWLSVALLLWGALCDSLAGAVFMAAMLDGLALAPIKWSLRDRDFHRAADLTSIVFVAVTALQFSRYSVHGIYEILAVSPYCFFPLALIQRASTAQTIPMSALFYSLRRPGQSVGRLDIAPHYLVVCLLAASTARPDGWWFICAAGALLVGVTAHARPRRYSAGQWLATLLLAGLLTAVTTGGLLATRRALEASMSYWFNQFAWLQGDPNTAVTAIGALGRLKLSDQIRVRVTPSPALSLPLFLQEASYDRFHYGAWTATEAPFAALDRERGQRAWALRTPPAADSRTLDIDFTHARELALLPVPRGTRRVASAAIAELQDNRFGTLKAESPPGALAYRVVHGEPSSVEPPPTAADSVVPEAYADVIGGILAGLASDALPPAGRIARIEAFFRDHFTYSLVQQGRPGLRTPLAHFLTRSRRGHCEYFASASVLLLRAAGIPARYAVGYVVESYSPLERVYIARARHAHAWALAWVDGAWRIVDTTPSTWYGLEEDYANRWQTVQDLASWLWYRWQRLLRADWEALNGWLAWLLPPLAVLLYVRLRRSPLAVRDEDMPTARRLAPALTGLFSPLFVMLAARGLEPRRGETLRRFLERAAPAAAGGVQRDDLVRAYYMLRYAPAREGTADMAGSAAAQELATLLARYCAALPAH